VSSASSLVVDGDILDTALNSGIATYGATNGTIGYVFGIKDNRLGCYLGRFELEIPAGSTINSVKFEMISSGVGSSSFITKRLALGFIADDSIWPASGISASTYYLRSSLPWARRLTVTTNTLIDNQAVWVGGSDPATLVSATNVIANGSAFSFGDGAAATYTTTGLVSNLQTWLDSSPDRGDSASGTAIPCCFSIVDNSATEYGHQGAFTDSSTVYTSNPSLTVEFTAPGGRVSATSIVSGVIDGRASITTGASSTASVSSTIAARGDVT